MINTNRKPTKPQSQISITSRKKQSDTPKLQSQNLPNPQENRIKKLEEELANTKRLLQKKNDEVIQKNRTIEELKRKLQAYESNPIQRRSNQRSSELYFEPQGKSIDLGINSVYPREEDIIFDQFEQMAVNEIIDPVREYEEHIIDELCPDPDHMTYDQLLELQEKIGIVNRGLNKTQIDKIPRMIFNPKQSNDFRYTSLCVDA